MFPPQISRKVYIELPSHRSLDVLSIEENMTFQRKNSPDWCKNLNQTNVYDQCSVNGKPLERSFTGEILAFGNLTL
jgi:hypothetical protein